MKRLLLFFALAGVLAAGIGLFRATRLVSRQVAPATPAAIAVDAASAAEKLAGAIRIPTVSWNDVTRRDAAAFDRLHEYLAMQFPLVTGTVAREVRSGYSLLYTWTGTDAAKPPVILAAHLDVVPPVEGGWTHEPFSGTIDGGRIFGRGAIDDKAAVVGILAAAEALIAAGFRPSRTIYFAFGHNEEGGGDASGAAGIAATLAARGVRNAWLLDEGGLIYDRMPGTTLPVALVGIAEKGFVNFELRVEAPGGHSATPPRETAVGVLARAIDRVERSPMPARLDGAALSTFETLAGDMSLPLRTIVANVAMTRPLLVQRLTASPDTNALVSTTFAPTMLAGSDKENVLATTARAVVNVRLLPGDSIAAVKAHLVRAVGDDRVAITAAGPSAEASPASPTDTPEFTALAASIRAVYSNVLVAPYLTIAATDGREYRGVTSGIYRFLPIHQADALSLMHGRNEYITIDGFAAAIRFYATLMTQVSGR